MSIQNVYFDPYTQMGYARLMNNEWADKPNIVAFTNSWSVKGVIQAVSIVYTTIAKITCTCAHVWYIHCASPMLLYRETSTIDALVAGLIPLLVGMIAPASSPGSFQFFNVTRLQHWKQRMGLGMKLHSPYLRVWLASHTYPSIIALKLILCRHPLINKSQQQRSKWQ